MELKTFFAKQSRRRLPQLNGRFYHPTLHHPVTIRRDQWGIPHIHAANRHDLFFAQGFVHAQDRLWQMELNRRAASGTLSAVFGSRTLPTDRLTRTLGFGRLASRSWELLPEPYRSDVVAYTAGVNGVIAGKRPFPLEFALVHHTPEPWQPLDTITYGRLQMWALTHGASCELINAELIAALGAERAADLALCYPDDQPVTLAAGIEVNGLKDSGSGGIAPFLGKGTLDGAGRGSNGWVIAAERSSTGAPILCNDMHLTVGTPSIWYYVHLQSDDGYHVSGFSQPGIPYVLTGHNPHLAWGATLAYTDCEDLFVEQFDPDNPTRYRFGDGWRPAETICETIAVRGRADHVEPVTVTHHGPLINAVLPSGQQPTALASMALAPDVTLDGFARLNEATNWAEFVAAIRHIPSPSLNFLYADRQGNIGHYLSGRVPLRAQGDGLLPAPGWAATHEWVGAVPFEQMPHTLNPASGLIVSANNKIVADDFPHFLGKTWRTGFRAQRIEAVLMKNGCADDADQGGFSRIEAEKFAPIRPNLHHRRIVSPADCAQLHLDFTSLPGQQFIHLLASHAPDTADGRLAHQLLQGWDGWLGAKSVGGAVYQVLLRQLTEILLEPHLDERLRHRLLGAGPHPILMPVNEFQGYWTVRLLRWLTVGEPGWLLGGREKTAVLNHALAQTTAVCRQLLGNDPSQWQWGRLHRVCFAHALGQLRPLDGVFNQGPFPIGGDIDTVAQTSIRADAPYDNNAISISSRHIVNLGDLSQGQMIIAPGQSGQLGSPHYGDLIGLWRTGGYVPVAWTEEQITAVCRHTLILKPGGV